MGDCTQSTISRRRFLGAAAGAGVMLMRPERVWGTTANSAVRLGVLGCGGRGLHVAASFLQHTSAVVTALGDLFADQLELGRTKLDLAAEKHGKPVIDARHLFRGPKAYEGLCRSSEVDAVYIATPPYFHPLHLEAALAAGKHVYLEKPVAVDVPGVHKVVALGEKAKGRSSLAVGFQIRHATPYVELVERVHAGQIGAPVSAEIHYFASAIKRPEWPNATPAERRLRNWIRDRTLSGDIIVEQNVHILDVTNWMLQAHPLKAIGSAGRAGRADGGDCASHYNCLFTYPGDVHVSFASTQFGKASWGVGMQYYGTKGCAQARYDAPVRLSGEERWEYPGLEPEPADPVLAAAGAFRGALNDADPNKQKAFVESIVSGRFVNEAASGAEAALTAMLGRTAAAKREEVTWEKLVRSKEVFDPRMDWNQFA
jgi:myo-inositol 2-dehydrogenase/D-chiro-inositol 1-dehydrogenase